MKSINIMIVGVGGQGTLLTSRLLGAALMMEGMSVKVSEVHGMSQRGGSVVTYVRGGDSVASPITLEGEADVILAFELLEAARWLPYLKKDGLIIAGTQQIDPMPVITGTAIYPENIVKKITDTGANLRAVDALSLAHKVGSPRVVNVIMIGMFAKSSSIKKEIFLTVLEQIVPEKFLEMNRLAFELGYNA